jgi:hypothetical protein
MLITFIASWRWRLDHIGDRMQISPMGNHPDGADCPDGRCEIGDASWNPTLTEKSDDVAVVPLLAMLNLPASALHYCQSLLGLLTARRLQRLRRKKT